MATNYQNMKNADLITVIERIECERDIMADAWHDTANELERVTAEREDARHKLSTSEGMVYNHWRPCVKDLQEALHDMTQQRDEAQEESAWHKKQRDRLHGLMLEAREERDKAENMRAFWRRQYYIETGDAFDE